MKKKEKSSHFYQLDRNIDNAKQSNTADINPKMFLSKEDLTDQYGGKTRSGGIENDHRVPEYYKGKEGYATTYILRAYRKHDTPVDCITKAIAHLEFELEKINQK